MILTDILAMTEDQAREHIEKIRWPNGPVCPHCKGTVAVKLAGKSTRPGLYKCKTKDCRKQFTVMVGSIFSDSHIPLKIWIAAFHLMCASKKGVSAHQIHRMLGVTYKSAWFLCHRIRFAMKQKPLAGMLTGIVEADEVWMGGKPRYKGISKARSR